MDGHAILEAVSQFGYPVLFFALWLGIVGMPIPDEAIVMTAGVAASLQYLEVIPAFLITYLGVVSGLSIGYILGKTIGAPVLDRLNRKKGMSRYVQKGQALLDKYGHYALCISYFLPVVRHVVPYLVGIGKMSFGRYALFSYTTGLVWTLLLFAVGYLLGNKAVYVEKMLGQMSGYLLWGACGLVLVVALVWGVRGRKA